MRAIIGASLRFRILVVAVAAAVLVLGFTQLRDAPVDVLPEFTPPYVEVQTEALGLSADGGRAADHGPARGRTCSTASPWRRRHPLGVGARAVVDRR